MRRLLVVTFSSSTVLKLLVDSYPLYLNQVLERKNEIIKLKEEEKIVIKESEIHEDVSTRLLVYTAKLIKEGFPPKEACRHAIVESLTDDEETIGVLEQLVALHFDEVEG